MNLNGVKKGKKSTTNKTKKFFDIDKSSIERIPLVPAKNNPTVLKYVDVDTNIDKAQIKIKNKI